MTHLKPLSRILIFALSLPASHASAEAFSSEAARKLVEQYGVDRIIMVKRATFQSSHYYTDFIDGCRFFGTDLCVLDLKSGSVTSLLPEQMKTGLINRIDVSFDARRVVFDWKADDQSGFHLWEVSVDGSGLRQLTFPPSDERETSRKYHLFKDKPYHWAKYPDKYPVDFGVYGHWSDDMHPCYLPDGGIAFVSTRCRYGILCDTPDIFTTTVLYRIDADGGNMQKLPIRQCPKLTRHSWRTVASSTPAGSMWTRGTYRSSAFGPWESMGRHRRKSMVTTSPCLHRWSMDARFQATQTCSSCQACHIAPKQALARSSGSIQTATFGRPKR